MARKAGSFGETTAPKVRDAAVRLIAEHGFAAVSMRQIAAEVGLQAGALYSYTPDKQTLLFDLIKSHLDDLLNAWAAVDRPDDPVERLEQFSRFHLRFLIKRPAASRLVEMELRNLSEQNRREVDALIARYQSILVAILEEGAATKTFTVPNTQLGAKGVLGLLTGVAAWARETEGMPARRVARISWNMVRRCVGAKGYQ
ncbi:MAG: TetR/AcrR family transcriptional regulator [Pseudomonadota bacterium]